MRARGLGSAVTQQSLGGSGSIPVICGTKNMERNIKKVVLGEDVMVTWYPGLYPNPPNDEKPLEADMLFVCEHCMRYTEDAYCMFNHMHQCPFKTDFPGDLAYSDEAYRIYRVDGSADHDFAQMLSLFGRLFIDSKSICYDVSYYYFFVMVEETPETGNRILGFFSKEKVSWDNNNLACILIFPNHQRKGLGQMLISFSYALSKLDEEIAGPEKPLSILGKKCYMAYWQNEVGCQIHDIPLNKAAKIEEISTATSIHPEDVLEALMAMKAVIKKRRGRYVISRKEVDNWARNHKITLGKYRLKHAIDERFAKRNSIMRPSSSGSDISISGSSGSRSPSPSLMASRSRSRSGSRSRSRSRSRPRSPLPKSSSSRKASPASRSILSS